MDGSIPAKKARADQSTWRPQTRAVRGGQLRSNFDETSEALFLTSGYAYQSAEEAEATFKGESGHYQYSRFGNPTVSHVREPAGRARRRRGVPRDLDRHVGGVLLPAGAAQGRRPHRGGAPALRLVPLHRGRPAAQVRHQGRVRRRRRPSSLGEGAVEAGAGRAVRIAVQPDARHRRHQGGVRHGAQGRRQGRARQRLRHADAAAAARMGRRHRRPLRHQVHRRPGPHPGRRDPGLQGVHPREAAAHHPQHRPVAQPVQCLGAGQGHGDAGPAHRPPLRQCRAGGRRAGRPIPPSRACSIPAAAIIRSTSLR